MVTRFQVVALAFLVLAGGALVAGFAGSPWVVLAVLLCLLAFRKWLLWRVRNRLLLSFLLSGVLPLILVAGMILLSGELFLSQLAADRVRQDVQARLAELTGVARDMATVASTSDSAALADVLRQRVPRMSVVIVSGGAVTRLPADGPLASVPAGLAATFEGVLQQNQAYYLTARAPGSARMTDVFVYLPLDEATLASLTSGSVEVTAIVHSNENVNIKGTQVSVESNGIRRTIVSRQLPGPTWWLDWLLAGATELPLLNPAGGDKEIGLLLYSRPSLLLAGVLQTRMAGIVGVLLAAMVVAFVVVELGSLLFTLLLARTVTRAVHELSKGTQFVAKGDFAHQIPVRGAHQLSELAASFNTMTQQIQHFLGEMKKKEKIESELEIARQVQARLFPRTVPELKTLTMQGVCIPGRFISGDYYDFVKLNNRYTAIALGDVSGKGVSAALLMASIQASLHAQLGFARGAESPVLSTATLMALIGQQLYESTPAEKYATFFLLGL